MHETSELPKWFSHFGSLFYLSGDISMKRFIYILFLIALISISCSESSRLGNSFRKPEDIGEAVVDALNNKNHALLHKYRVTKQEYLNYLWDSFSASKHWPKDYAWNNLNIHCIKGVNRWVNRYGGKELEFVSITFEKEPKTYDEFEILSGTVLTVKNNQGKEMVLPILGSVVKMDGRYKLLSYDEG